MGHPGDLAKKFLAIKIAFFRTLLPTSRASGHLAGLRRLWNVIKIWNTGAWPCGARIPFFRIVGTRSLRAAGIFEPRITLSARIKD
jgi:hypothetical protein